MFNIAIIGGMKHWDLKYNRGESATRRPWRMARRITRYLTVLAGLILVLTHYSLHAGDKEMIVGDRAPEFSLIDQSGKRRSLADFRDRWVVLYFYPKDDTPGCTREACRFRDDYERVRVLGAEILGVSIDSQDRHAAFHGKYNLPFPLLADSEGAVAKQYGALWGVWPLRFARRHTFLIDPDGNIAKIYRRVDPNTHSLEVIQDLKSLQAGKGGPDPLEP